MRTVSFAAAFGKRPRRVANAIIQHVEFADVVIIESPRALANLHSFFNYWRRPDLLPRFRFVPNPVAPGILNTQLEPKRNAVISVGNWKDPRKNVYGLVDSARDFLGRMPKWKMRIIGQGQDFVQERLSRWPQDLRIRTELHDLIPHSNVIELLNESRIFFSPSLRESWGIAAAEALCMGCTIVGPPLESFAFLADDGLFRNARSRLQT